MKTSVAIATYNGEKFIQEQLESILNQTTPPNEIIIIDDFSTDNTVEVIERIKTNSNVNIQIYKNNENIGVTRSFDKAISKCTNEIIFLSDQDDVWVNDKIKFYIRYFEENENCNLLFSNALLVDENLNNLHKTYWEASGFKNSKIINFPRNPIKYLTEWCYTLGNTIAFRKNIVKNILPFPYQIKNFEKFMLHDGYIPFAIETLNPNSVQMLNKSLVKYRIHKNQYSGVPKNTFLGKLNKLKVQYLNSDFINFHKELREELLKR